MAAETANAKWTKWHSEFELARKARGYREWIEASKKIVARYRDDRKDHGAGDGMGAGEADRGAKFNILWSNVQTLQPALLAKPPKPVVERRYMDRDDVGRTASVILERALSYEIDDGFYLHSLKRGVLDRLLPGRGIVWVRYDPRFEQGQKAEDEGDGDVSVGPSVGAVPGGNSGSGSGGASGDGNVNASLVERVASESAPVDYIDYRDFLHSTARTWPEVWWIAKLVYMTRAEAEKRFGTEKGGAIPLDWTPAESQQAQPGTTLGDNKDFARAKVWEIWDKRERKVIWISEGWTDDVLDERDDPLKLEDFWPIPEPLFATLTNESLVPRPDFAEYQDQALELDDLTLRISKLTQAIKVTGVFDASIPELARIFEEGFENRLVGVAAMSEFTQKAQTKEGMGALWLLPMQDMAQTLIHLQNAREIVKQSLYEITGISDIVRGQSGADTGAKTATEQRIKGQFASLRLNYMQSDVARFARDTLRIMGEIIAEHFDRTTLRLISGYDQWAREQWPPESFMPGSEPGMGHNGGPPMDSPQPAPSPVGAGFGAAGGSLPPDAAGPLPPMGAMPPMAPMGPTPEMMAKAKADEMFERAVTLLRNDKLRGFRIDIETDSMIEPDQQAMQQARTEFMGAVSQFLPQAMEAALANPSMAPLLARLMMFTVRGFKASRDIESAFEQFIADQEKAAKNPKPKPLSEAEVKAQTEIQKQKMEGERQQQQMAGDAAKMQAEAQRAQMDMQNEQQRMAMEMEIAQQKAALEMQMMQAKMQFEREKLELQERKLMLDAAAAQQKHQLDAQAMQNEAVMDEQSMMRQEEMSASEHERGIEASEHKHELGMEVMDAKAKQAKAAPKGKANA